MAQGRQTPASPLTDIFGGMQLDHALRRQGIPSTPMQTELPPSWQQGGPPVAPTGLPVVAAPAAAPSWWGRNAPAMLGGAAAAPVAVMPALKEHLTTKFSPAGPARQEGSEGTGRPFIPGLTMGTLLQLMQASKPTQRVPMRDIAMEEYIGLNRIQRDQRLAAAKTPADERAIQDQYLSSLGGIVGKLTLAQQMAGMKEPD